MSSGFVPEIYAIDFGTTNSLLAAADAQRVVAPIELDPSARDATILRSVLYFPNATRCFYGSAALAEYTAAGGQGRLIRSIKKHLPSRSFIGTFIDERPMNLEDLIGAFLGEMRARANRHFGCDVRRVVLGRPARFAVDDAEDSHAQYRLERAARVAGFEEISFCPEPIAAAREFRSTLREQKRVLVGDFGGGTSDFTVLQMHEGAFRPSDVLAIGGVPVAGDAFDSAIMRRHVGRHFGTEVRYRVPFGNNVLQMPPGLMEKICTPADASLLQTEQAMTFLRNLKDWSLGDDDQRCIEQLLIFVEDRLGFAVFEAIEGTKRELSTNERAVFSYEYPGIEIEEPIERSAFEQSSATATERIVAELDATLRRAGLGPDGIDIVCCTGGTARLPAVEQALAARFGADKLTQFENFHSVILGLSEHARSLLN
ncbi:MAG TPA: Hsp70 family protein [Polyangiales bacterium]|nr:Hsp70 family protein [Polyangiales bacterium]